MYICVCNAVTESAIRQAATGGARSFRDLMMHTGCSTQCGRCVGMARQVFDEALEEIGSPPSTVALSVVASS